MKKLGAIVLITALVLQLFSISIFADESGDTYFVSPNGRDIAGAGTIDNPFKTISYASKFLKPSDTCYIREGVYRETVTPMNNGTADKPITYAAYNNEEVVISGCDLVTDWSRHEGNIYKASMDWDMGTGEGNIIYADGKLGFEGRWPNNQDSLLDCYSYPKLTGAAVTQLDTSYAKVVANGVNIPIVEAGTKLWVVADPAYFSVTGVLTEPSTRTSITAKIRNGNEPISGDIYALVGSLSLVDVEGEWYKDRTNKLLYLYSNVDPNTIKVEAKKRDYGIDLSDRKNIVFDGVGLRATSIKTNDNTSYCTYKGATIKTINRDMVEIGYPSADGITLYGTHNTIMGCEILDCYGVAIQMRGSYNRVVNNLIQNTNFEGSNGRTVWIYGSNQLVSHNTICDTGRFAAGGTFVDSVVSYNDMYHTEGLTKDGGVFYLNDNDYGMSEIHHNYFHDNLDPAGLAQMGLYFDTATCGLLVYNNIIWNIDHQADQTPLCAATWSDYCIYFNNTIINHRSRMGHYEETTAVLNGGTYINNLFAREGHLEGYPESKGWIYENNKEDGRAERDIVDGDWTGDVKFALQPGSKAIDGGIIIPGVTDGFVGSAPDIGAREYDDPNPWVAGHDFSKMEEYDQPFALNLELPFKNMLKNREFEHDLDGWETVSGTPSLVNQSAWGYSYAPLAGTKNGYYGLMLQEGDEVTQRIDDLKPNTQYDLYCFSKTSGEFVNWNKYKSVMANNMSTSTGRLECQDGNYAWASFMVDFDQGQFNTIRLAVFDVKTPSSFCAIRLGSENGTEIGRADLERKTGQTQWNNINFYDVEFDENLTGEQEVFFVFDSGGTGLLKNTKFHGYELIDGPVTDQAQFKVVTDSGEVQTHVEARTEYSRTPVKLTFTTGQDGYADISLKHLGGNNTVYFDSLGVQEKFTGTIPPQPVLLKNVRLTDLEGNAVTSIKDNTLGIVDLTFGNNTSRDITVTGSVSSYTATGKKGDVVTIDSPISANKTETLGLGITIADSKGYLVLEFILNEDEVFEYHIPVWQLSNGMNADVLLKGLVINGGSSTSLVENQTNTLAVSVNNSSASSTYCTGYVAIYEYEDGTPRLVSITNVRDTIDPGYDTIQFSVDVPEAEGELSATLLLWRDDGSLQPITEVYKFK